MPSVALAGLDTRKNVPRQTLEPARGIGAHSFVVFVLPVNEMVQRPPMFNVSCTKARIRESGGIGGFECTQLEKRCRAVVSFLP